MCDGVGVRIVNADESVFRTVEFSWNAIDTNLVRLENGAHLVILGLGNGVVHVVVTLGATHG